MNDEFDTNELEQGLDDAGIEILETEDVASEEDDITEGVVEDEDEDDHEIIMDTYDDDTLEAF